MRISITGVFQGSLFCFISVFLVHGPLPSFAGPAIKPQIENGQNSTLWAQTLQLKSNAKTDFFRLKRKNNADIILHTGPLELSLKEVIQKTLENNLGIAVQRYESKIKKENIITEEADFDVILSLEATDSNNEIPSANTFIKPPVVKTKGQEWKLGLSQKLKLGTEYEFNFSGQKNNTNSAFAGLRPEYDTRVELNLTQPLLKNFGVDTNSADIYIAKNNLDISDFEFKEKVIEILGNTENVYWDLVFSREDLQVQLKSVARARDLERRVRAQVEVGTMAPLEILQAQSEVASREQAVIQVHKDIGDNEDDLKNILNMDFGSNEGMREILPQDKPSFSMSEPIDLGASIKTALQKRPDYLTKKKELDSKNILVQFNENQLYPSLDLIASFGLNGLSGDAQSLTAGPFDGNYGDSIDRAFSGDFLSWEAGVKLSYPLGNRAAKSRLLASKLESSQLLMEIKDLEKTIILEVREAVRQIKTDVKRIQAARIARKLAEEKLSAEEKKFEVGLSTSFNVLEFQTDLAEEQSNELKAIVDYKKSRVKFRSVLATTLENYNIKLSSDK